MGGFVADCTEVIYRADNAPAKNVLPYAIDHYSRSQGILRTGDDLRKFVAPATARGKRRLSQDVLEESALSRLTMGLRVAADKYGEFCAGPFICESFHYSWRRYCRFHCPIFVNQFLKPRSCTGSIRQ